MKKKTSTKKKNNSASRTVKKPATKKTPAGKKKPASKKRSATNKKPVSKKKPAGKKKPASPKKASKPAGKKKPASNATGHRAAEKKHSKAAQRPRILPKDTPFPLNFSARSNKAIEKYVYNKKSGIHGMGAFARSRIPKGAYVGSYEGIPSLDDDIYVLWVEQDSGSWRGIDGKNELRYLNHSSRPNVEWDENRLYSIRAIEPDEELTFHYGDEWEDVE